jgi:hypothetical protein
VIATFSVGGAENATKDEYIKFETKVDEPFVRHGRLCNQTDCRQLQVIPLSVETPALADKEDWLVAIMRSRKNKETAQSLYASIRESLESLGQSAGGIRDKAKRETVAVMQKKLAAGDIAKMTLGQLEETLAELNAIAAEIAPTDSL